LSCLGLPTVVARTRESCLLPFSDLEFQEFIMPLHVPPVSRREFLAGTVSAGAALLSLRGLSANEPDVDSDSWAFLSDTHIWSKRNEMVRGVKMADNLTRVGEQLRALPGRPGGVFINGDCAYLEGEAGDYDAFADLLKPLGRWGLPVHMTMGNHDNRERFWTALNEKGKSRPLEGRQISVVETPRANWFLLDSLTETNKTPGLLGQDQLDWLAKALDVYGAKPAIIFTHHHPDPGRRDAADRTPVPAPSDRE
jgi:hypothetical protein